MFMDLSPEFTNVQVRLIVQGLIALILSVAVHEFGHAIVAHWLGDGTPKHQGRVTLDPRAHADSVGTLLIPSAFLIITKGAGIGFGWGKPVMVNPRSFSRRFTMRTGHMMVAFAGPAMNILFGLVITGVLFALVQTGTVTVDPATGSLYRAISGAVLLNFVLFFFNLIPAHPLDGAAVITGLLPRRYVAQFEEIQKYGIFVLLAILMIPQLGELFFRPALWLHQGVFWLFGLPGW